MLFPVGAEAAYATYHPAARGPHQDGRDDRGGATSRTALVTASCHCPVFVKEQPDLRSRVAGGADCSFPSRFRGAHCTQRKLFQKLIGEGKTDLQAATEVVSTNAFTSILSGSSRPEV